MLRGADKSHLGAVYLNLVSGGSNLEVFNHRFGLAALVGEGYNGCGGHTLCIVLIIGNCRNGNKILIVCLEFLLGNCNTADFNALKGVAIGFFVMRCCNIKLYRGSARLNLYALCVGNIFDKEQAVEDIAAVVRGRSKAACTYLHYSFVALIVNGIVAVVLLGRLKADFYASNLDGNIKIGLVETVLFNVLLGIGVGITAIGCNTVGEEGYNVSYIFIVTGAPCGAGNNIGGKGLNVVYLLGLDNILAAKGVALKMSLSHIMS